MSSEVIFLSEVSHWKSQFQEVTVRRNKKLLDEVKNIAGQALKYNSKNWIKNLNVLKANQNTNNIISKNWETETIKQTKQKNTHY